ncbi:MAG: protease DO family protein [Chloroflexi bacterium]|nr:protease DO family protein [Chloroflexota bacterium]
MTISNPIIFITLLFVIFSIVSCSEENANNNNPKLQIIEENNPITKRITIPEIVDLIAPSVVEIATYGKSETGVATGLILDSEGHILTNKHVIKYAEAITVAFNNGKTLKGSKYREDPILDLAIIKVDNNNIKLIPAKFGNSNNLRVGEDVIAIGHALGLEGGPSVSKGIISALNRTISDGVENDMTGLIQTDAAINSGNSGGPLVNNEGEVIGINTIRTGSDGIGFAININNSLDSAKKLIALGDPPPPGYLGISFDEITPALAFLFDLPTNHLWITYINPGSPAEVSGLKIDDIIISMNDSKIQNGANLTEFLRTHQAGNKINITLLRDRSYLLETEVILGERPN